MDNDDMPDWIIGAPNVDCGGNNSSCITYLYLSGNNYDPIAFYPPEEDPDWNAFGWDARIITTSDGEAFLFAGEPGRNDPDYASGRVYIYRYEP
jgi:hypothetical protein